MPDLTLPRTLSLCALILAAAAVDGAVVRVPTGRGLTLEAECHGTPPFTYLWTRNGQPHSVQHAPRLTWEQIEEADAGLYQVTVTNSVGASTSELIEVAVEPSAIPSYLYLPPPPSALAEGASWTWQASVIGVPESSFRWWRDGQLLAETTESRLQLSSVTSFSTGLYAVEVRIGGEWVRSAPVPLRVSGGSESRLSNFSIRAQVPAEDRPLIVGMAVQGERPLPMLMRGVGPGLAPFGVSKAAVDPSLLLFRGALLTHKLDNWADSAWGVSSVAMLSRFVGAFPLRLGSLDAAEIFFLSGNSTIHVPVTAVANDQVVLLETYDLVQPASARWSNFSALASTGAGEATLIMGFSVEGSAPLSLLVRGVGPSLRTFGVPQPLEDPKLTLWRDGVLLAENDNWNANETLISASTRGGAFALPAGSRDAVLLLDLPPGLYSTHLTDQTGRGGRAMIEVYVIRTP